MRRSTKKRGRMPARDTKRNTGYRFIDKDPIIDRIRKDIEDSGLSIHAIAERSFLSHGCIKNWLTGKTRRPQHYTIWFVYKTLGYDYEPVKRR